MAAWRYEISLLVLKKYFSTLEEKFRISARPCNILYFSTLSDTLMAKILVFLPEHSKFLSLSEMTSTPVILLWEYPGHQDLGLKIIYSLTKHLFKLNYLLTACNNDNQWQDKMEKCHILEDSFQTSQ